MCARGSRHIKGQISQGGHLKNFCLHVILCSQRGRKGEHLIPVRKHLGPLHKHSLTLCWVILRVKGRLLLFWLCSGWGFYKFNLNRQFWGHGVVLSIIVPVLFLSVFLTHKHTYCICIYIHSCSIKSKKIPKMWQIMAYQLFITWTCIYIKFLCELYKFLYEFL